MKNILVLNTFSVQSTFPSFNTAYITALMKQSRLNVLNYDINQKIWTVLLSGKYLASLKYNKCVLENWSCPFCENLNEHDFLKLQSKVVKEIDCAIFKLRHYVYNNINDLEEINRVIFQSKVLIYNSFGTFFTTHMPYWNTIGFDVSDVDDIYRVANDSRINPLIDIIKKEILIFIQKGNFDIIMMDIMFPWDIISALTFTILIKKAMPNIHVNYTGQGFDEFCFSRILDKLHKDTKFYFGFDSIFVYKNNVGIVNLVKRIREGKDLNGIDNLYYIDGYGEIHTNILTNKYGFNHNICPNYDDIDFNQYLISERVLIDRLSYRCYWSKCSFCSINSNKSICTQIDLKKLAQRIKYLKNKYKVENFWFLDEACKPQFAIKFAEILKKEDINIYWSLRTRIGSGWNKSTLAYLYKCGLRELWIGLEHVSRRMLTLMNKSNDIENYPTLASQILSDATSLGIGLHFCHILGYPSETDDDRNQVLNFYHNNKEHIKRMPFFATFNVFGLMYGSEMYKNPKKFGITEIIESTGGYYMVSIPYKTIYRDSTNERSSIVCLNKWINLFLKELIENDSKTSLWMDISDTPFEMLLKKYFLYNPF